MDAYLPFTLRQKMKKPNIVYYHSHDTGRYIQPYGYQVPTPNLQKLAEEGVVFRKAFCTSPTCSPSRAGLFTGSASHSVGMLGLAHRGFALDDYSKTLVGVLNQAGYATVLCGVQHIVPHEELDQLGYEKLLLNEPSPNAENASSRAVEFLRERDPDRPFFLDVGVFETHRYQSKKHLNGAFHPDGVQGDGCYVRPPEPIPDMAETRQDWADYCASAQRMDEGLGRVRRELEAQGIVEDTIIVYTTDHGPAFPHMKCTLSDYGIQVALIVRFPGAKYGGRVEGGLISHADVLPSLCEMIGTKAPFPVQGKSWMPLLDENMAIRKHVFAEINYHAVDNAMRCVRTDRYKLIRRYVNNPDAVIRCCDMSLSKDAFLQAGWDRWTRSDVEFYDLVLDPTESCNLADEESYGEVRTLLERELDRWMIDTDDPLLGEIHASSDDVKGRFSGILTQQERG